MFTFLGIVVAALVTGVLIIIVSINWLAGEPNLPSRQPRSSVPEAPAPKLTKLGRPIEIQRTS